MANSKMDLIMHPIRMRIIQALIAGKPMTTQQLSEMLKDVPQATMYRHLNKLSQAKLIHVVEEKQVRGTTEKVYALAADGADATPQDVTKMSADEHRQLFMKFVMGLVGDFDEYLQQDHYDLVKDGITFRQTQFYLTDEEYKQMLVDVREQMARYMGNKPGHGRRRRMMSTIVIPEKNNADSNKLEG
ncbi:helix-turn-helix domain-containing protein [Paenibacillus sp. SN-8-1]|uniref:helix-turn-helix domain-containing protein n=1 Tax=Paenibacillus sp. SN-8-1 TaxID=3435409 RepID=UPI003D9A7CEA